MGGHGLRRNKQRGTATDKERMRAHSGVESPPMRHQEKRPPSLDRAGRPRRSNLSWIATVESLREGREPTVLSTGRKTGSGPRLRVGTSDGIHDERPDLGRFKCFLVLRGPCRPHPMHRQHRAKTSNPFVRSHVCSGIANHTRTAHHHSRGFRPKMVVPRRLKSPLGYRPSLCRTRRKTAVANGSAVVASLITQL